MNSNGIEYDKKQLKENLKGLEDKFRNGQMGEREYITRKEEYQSMLYEDEVNKLIENSFKHEDYNYSSPGGGLGTLIGWIVGKLMIKQPPKTK